MDLSQAVEELNSLLEQRQQASELIDSIEDGSEQGEMRKLVDDLDEAIHIQYELIQQMKQPKQSDGYRVGDPVMIMSGDTYHVGIVKSVLAAEQNTVNAQEPLFECYMLGTEPSNTFTVDSSKLAPFRDPPMEFVTQGTKCLAVYDHDHHFYECIIDDVDTENREVTVTFTGYGNVQKCALTHIRLTEHPEIYSHSAIQQQQNQTPVITHAVSAATSESEITVVDEVVPVTSQQQEEIVETIPPARPQQTATATPRATHLRSPTHTAESRPVSSANEPKKKKKKKKESKAAKQGIEKQQKWKSFISSGKRGIRKSESIFSSPSAPDTGLGIMTGTKKSDDRRETPSRQNHRVGQHQNHRIATPDELNRQISSQQSSRR